MEFLKTARSDSREAGVTLVETLVALLILSLVSVSVLAMFSQAMQLNISGADYTALVNTAKDKSEELLALEFTHADLTAGVSHSENRTDPPFTINWRVAEHSLIQGASDPASLFAGDPMTSTVGAGNGNLKVLAVTVSTQGVLGVGRRNATVQAMKVAD